MRLTRLWAALPGAVLIASTAVGQQCARPMACGQPGYGPTLTDSCEEVYFQNSIWPRQYIAPARRGICQSMELMVHNGWRRQNLLGKYHFDPNGDQLTEAGKLKVDWILTQAPPQRRSIFVERAATADQTAQRVQAVQDLAASTSGASTPADVQETHLHDEGHPALAVDAVFTGFTASQRTPSLPTAAGASGGSSGSSEQASR